MNDVLSIADSEREDLANLLEVVVRQYLNDAAIPPVTDTYEEVFGPSAIGRFPSTLEMRFFIEDLSAFTPDFANRLRKQVISQFPDWTVVPQYGEMEFTVSPHGVLFGSKNVKKPITADNEHYQSWLRKAERYDEKRIGPLRRQFKYVTPLIPNAIPTVNEKGAAILAAFDTYVPPVWEGNPVVWLLVEGGRETPEMTPACNTGLSRTVTRNGIIEPAYSRKYWPATRARSPLFLIAGDLVWKDRHRLFVVLQGWADKVPDRKLGPFRVDELIKDADLKAKRR